MLGSAFRLSTGHTRRNPGVLIFHQCMIRFITLADPGPGGGGGGGGAVIAGSATCLEMF